MGQWAWQLEGRDSECSEKQSLQRRREREREQSVENKRWQRFASITSCVCVFLGAVASVLYLPPSPPACLPAHTDNNVDTQRRMHALFALNRARVVRIAVVVVVAVVLLAYCCSWKVGYVVVIAVVSLIHPRAISCSN